MPIAIAHSAVRGAVVSSRRVAEIRVETEPDHDHDRADHLATPDMLPRQEVAERQREDDGRDEQRLDDRDPPAIERGRLKDVAGEQRERPEQPPRLPDEAHERLRVGERDLREVECPFCCSVAASAKRNAAMSARTSATGADYDTAGRWQLQRVVEPRWAADSLPVAAERTRRSGVSPNADAAVTSSRSSSAVTAGTYPGSTDDLELEQRRPEPPHHLDRRAAVDPDLGDAEGEVVLEPVGGHHESKLALASSRYSQRPSRPAVRPISPSVSSRWSITCTAVVGSLTAGESARIATSTRIRRAKAGSWSIVRSIPSASLPARRRSAILGKLPSRTPRAARHPRRRSRRPRAATRSPRRGGSPRREGLRHRSPGAHPTRCCGRRAKAPARGWPRARHPRRSVAASSRARPLPEAPRAHECAAIDATLTGRSRWRTRSRKTRNRTRPAASRKPAIDTPRLGTASSIRRISVYENTSVPINTASVALRTLSRYQSRMYRAENVPVAICTTSTLTVTTNPINPTEAPATVVSAVKAVCGA